MNGKLWLYWLRFNVILGWLFIWLCDVGIAWTGAMSWTEARAISNDKLGRIWNGEDISKAH